MGPLLSWWVLLEALGLLAFPLVFRLFGPGMAHGYPFAKVLSVLLLGYLAWLGGYLLPARVALHGALGLLAIAGVAVALRDARALAAWLRQGGLADIVRHDALWTGGFLFFAWQRSMVPDVFGAEKFMDFAFLNALVRAEGMPPPDPWMSGETINYYYFGYLLFADLVRLVGLSTFVAYNLCVATIGGLALSQTAAVVLGLTRRWGLALLGGALSALLGNLDGFLQLVEKGTLRGIDVWRSSRIVGRGDTINEFPFFSTIHGDLHPHFMVLPVGILLLAVLLDERLFPSSAEEQTPRRRMAALSLTAFVLGAAVAISPWELPLGALALLVLGGRSLASLPWRSGRWLRFVGEALAVLAVAYLLFLPFYVGFDPPPSGPAIRLATTSLAEFLTVWGLLLFPPAVLVAARGFSLLPGDALLARWAVAVAGLGLLSAAAAAGNAVLPLLAVFLACTVWVACRGPGAERVGHLLVAIALVALLACEVVYLRDAYGEALYRMNTVFKLYFQAWAVLSIAAPWCVGRILSRASGAPRWQPAFATALGLLVAAAACYPIGVTLDRSGWPIERGLDGSAYLRRDHPGDLAAIGWLRENVRGQEVILETTGGPYSYFARFSSNTGLPTVLGWANHEALWRAGDPRVDERVREVKRIYDSVSPLADVEALLDRYDVRYVIVGDLEREHHAADGLAKFAELPAVFRSGQTIIYARDPR